LKKEEEGNMSSKHIDLELMRERINQYSDGALTQVEFVNGMTSQLDAFRRSNTRTVLIKFETTLAPEELHDLLCRVIYESDLLSELNINTVWDVKLME
jgi:hypothetical protein